MRRRKWDARPERHSLQHTIGLCGHGHCCLHRCENTDVLLLRGGRRRLLLPGSTWAIKSRPAGPRMQSPCEWPSGSVSPAENPAAASPATEYPRGGTAECRLMNMRLWLVVLALLKYT